jgi:hypothetical protein
VQYDSQVTCRILDVTLYLDQGCKLSCGPVVRSALTDNTAPKTLSWFRVKDEEYWGPSVFHSLPKTAQPLIDFEVKDLMGIGGFRYEE